MKSTKTRRQSNVSQLSAIYEYSPIDYCDRHTFDMRSNLISKLEAKTFEDLTRKLEKFYNNDQQNKAKTLTPTTFFYCNFISPQDATNSHTECRAYCNSEKKLSNH